MWSPIETEPFGIYDMHGKSAGMVSRLARELHAEAVTDPVALTERPEAGLRGGALGELTQLMRSAARRYTPKNQGHTNIGVRLIAEIEELE